MTEREKDMKEEDVIRTGETQDARIEQDPCTLLYTVRLGDRLWRQDERFSPSVIFSEGRELPFADAGRITRESYRSGLGEGILTRYEDFTLDGEEIPFSFETLAWCEEASGDVLFELIPVKDGIPFSQIRWPGYFCFDSPDAKACTVMPVGQGVLIPNTWPEEAGRLPFNGQFESSGAYMPWFGQTEEGSAYLAVCETPWDAGYYCLHPAGGPYTHVGFYWLPSLGRLSYRRVARFSAPEGCTDYNGLCKAYRSYAKEHGLFTTLREKAVRFPKLEQLVGASVIHLGTRMQISPSSVFYDAEHPERCDRVVPFRQTAEKMKDYRRKGLKKAYLHLDGWGEAGYDSGHPDCLPPAKEAGGWAGLAARQEPGRECGYRFGLPDPDRAYDFTAPTFDEAFACRDADGKIPGMCRYAGGEQRYLCATQAPGYVKRNYEALAAHGIRPDAVYLDVFTCNPPDECAAPRHKMTRRECLAFRGECFSLLTSRGILPSSEECADWAMRDLVFAHYGPYEFMLQKPGTPRRGIPVPLFNLVYHDCFLLPWPMDRREGTEDCLLYCLLNGGMPYLDREAPYPNSDGVYGEDTEMPEEERFDRCRVAAQFHEKVAYSEMVRHEFPDGDWRHQRAVYANGFSVSIDLEAGTYRVEGPSGSYKEDRREKE